MGLELTTDKYPPITSQTRYPLLHAASKYSCIHACVLSTDMLVYYPLICLCIIH